MNADWVQSSGTRWRQAWVQSTGTKQRRKQQSDRPGTISRLRVTALLLAFAILLVLPGVPAHAQSGKVIRMVVPFAAGGARELLARTFHNELGAALGQTVVLDNRPGAGGAIGTAAVARAKPDGLTLLFAGSSHNVTAIITQPTPYDPLADFATVANVGLQNYVLMTPAVLPATTLAEFIRLAKASPGKLNYSSPGHGSSGHLAMAYLNTLAGLDIVHIPFKSTQDAITDVVAGRSQATVVANIGAVPYEKDPHVRLIAVTSNHRSSFLQNVPTVAEAGVPGYVYESWFGILAPAATPRPVIDRINREMNKLLADKLIQGRLAALGVEPLPLTPTAMEQMMRRDLDEMRNVVSAAGNLRSN